MGYLCPVCEEPFGDEGQCANHLAVTAILHGDDHEAWLAETVDERLDADDWESVPRADLAAIVAETAEETTDHDHPGDHTHPVDGQSVGGGQPIGETPAVDDGQPVGSEPATQGRPAITESNAETAQLDADAQAILNEARELTRKMQNRGPDDEGKES